jgi:hypothetical protein
VLNKAQTTGGGWLPDWPWTTLSRPEDKQRLIQRARLAAGYAALDAGQFGEAEQWLMTIPENTIGARQAILGYGWSHYQRGDFVQALGAWQALASTPVVSGQISPQEMEAGLGVALAYDRLSQPRLALDQYQSLAKYLDQHLGSIKSLLVEDRLLVDDEVLMQRYLLSWQASEVYVRQMGRRAELQTLVQQNQDWLGKLDIYRAALQGKDQLRQQQANRVASAGFSQRIAGVQQQQQALAERLSVIKQRQDVTALVSAKQYRLRQRVEKARSSWQLLMTARAGFAADHVGVTDIPTSARLEQADQALRLYAGLLDWDAGLGWHDALWQLEKRQRSAVESLTAAKARQTSIEQLLRDSTDIAPLLAQLEKLQTQLQRQAMQLKQHITAANASLLAGQNSALLAHQEMSRAQMAQIQFNMGAAFDQSTRSVTAGLRAEP